MKLTQYIVLVLVYCKYCLCIPFVEGKRKKQKIETETENDLFHIAKSNVAGTTAAAYMHKGVISILLISVLVFLWCKGKHFTWAEQWLLSEYWWQHLLLFYFHRHFCELTFHYNGLPNVSRLLGQGSYTGLEGVYQIFTALFSLLSDTETQRQIYGLHTYPITAHGSELL